MPLVTFNREFYNRAYRFHVDGRTLGYTRHTLMPLARTWARGIGRALDWDKQTPASVVVVNAGYGFLAEAFAAGGLTAYAVETSADLQATKDSDERDTLQAAGVPDDQLDRYLDGARAKVALLDEPLTTKASRDRLKALAGAGLVIVTDHLLPYLTDGEAQTLSVRLHALDATAVHLVTPEQPGNHPGYNWHTLAAWKALLPADTLIDDDTFEVA